MIDHVGFEVSDLERSARFYDAVFFALGGRRMFEGDGEIAYGISGRSLWISRQAGAPAAGNGHVALQSRGRAGVDAAYAAGLAAGGSDDCAPTSRPEYGPLGYAARLRDPDGLRVEVVTGGH